MAKRRPVYKWFYDHVHSREYDLALRWFLLPFGGEARFRREMMEPLSFAAGERILDLCCGTRSSTLAIRAKAGLARTQKIPKFHGTLQVVLGWTWSGAAGFPGRGGSASLAVRARPRRGGSP